MVLGEFARQSIQWYTTSSPAIVTFTFPWNPSPLFVKNVIDSGLDDSSMLSDSPRLAFVGNRWCKILLSASYTVKPNIPWAPEKPRVSHVNTGSTKYWIKFIVHSGMTSYMMDVLTRSIFKISIKTFLAILGPQRSMTILWQFLQDIFTRIKLMLCVAILASPCQTFGASTS